MALGPFFRSTLKPQKGRSVCEQHRWWSELEMMLLDPLLYLLLANNMRIYLESFFQLMKFWVVLTMLHYKGHFSEGHQTLEISKHSLPNGPLVKSPPPFMWGNGQKLTSAFPSTVKPAHRICRSGLWSGQNSCTVNLLRPTCLQSKNRQVLSACMKASECLERLGSDVREASRWQDVILLSPAGWTTRSNPRDW